MTGILLALLFTTLMYSTPLIFAALGGVISEVSGVVNIGIEGMMSIGAFLGAAVALFTGNPWLGLVSGGLGGAVLALLHAVASVHFRADQTISGVALNFIGPGLALFLCRRLFNNQTITPYVPNKIPKVFGSVDATAVLALFCALVIGFFMYKTKWGLRQRAVGQHPAAADTLGISVYNVRYVCVLASGFLAGIGGASVTLAVVSQFSPTVISGQGFIALAAVIFGKWTPYGAYGACLLFGLAQAVVVFIGGDKMAIPSEILSMLPYVLTLAVLVLFVGRSAAPKASGKPYEKGHR